MVSQITIRLILDQVKTFMPSLVTPYIESLLLKHRLPQHVLSLDKPSDWSGVKNVQFVGQKVERKNSESSFEEPGPGCQKLSVTLVTDL